MAALLFLPNTLNSGFQIWPKRFSLWKEEEKETTCVSERLRCNRSLIVVYLSVVVNSNLNSNSNSNVCRCFFAHSNLSPSFQIYSLLLLWVNYFMQSILLLPTHDTLCWPPIIKLEKLAYFRLSDLSLAMVYFRAQSLILVNQFRLLFGGSRLLVDIFVRGAITATCIVVVVVVVSKFWNWGCPNRVIMRNDIALFGWLICVSISSHVRETLELGRQFEPAKMRMLFSKLPLLRSFMLL